MKSFIGLMKKELLVSRFWYITYLILLIAGLTIGTYISHRVELPSLVFPMIMTAIPFHFIFMPLIVYSLLRMEGKTQLWLYNPQSSYKLLFTKILTAFLYQLVSQLIFTVAGIWFTNTMGGEGAENWLTTGNILFLNITLLALAAYLTIWTIFLWSVYHSLGKFPAWKNFRWLAVALIILLNNTLETIYMTTEAITNFAYKWTFDLSATLGVSYETATGWSFTVEIIPVPIIPIIYSIFVSVILFIASSALLDKKVEV